MSGTNADRKYKKLRGCCLTWWLATVHTCIYLYIPVHTCTNIQNVAWIANAHKVLQIKDGVNRFRAVVHTLKMLPNMVVSDCTYLYIPVLTLRLVHATVIQTLLIRDPWMENLHHP